MGILSKLFTWWDGATVGTLLFSALNGEHVGTDAQGNEYYRKKAEDGRPERRWVIYAGANDSSRVPPGWNAWLRGTIDDLPDKSLPTRRVFEKAPLPNVTGTSAAYRPSGSLLGAGQRPAATGDYQAWKPE